MASTGDATAAVAANLMPSQVINSTSQQNQRRGGRNNRSKKKNQANTNDANVTNQTNATATTAAGNLGNDNNQVEKSKPRNSKQQKKPQGSKPSNNKDADNAKLPKNQDKPDSKMPPQAKNANAKKRNNRQRKRFPWRKHIPAESDDPITLESLHTLTYPPFALVATEPYDPVEEWPIPETAEEDSKLAVETKEERERRILQEQWGELKLTGNKSTEPSAETTTAVPSASTTKRHYHLFDGRALAYYMVSELQFIDPLNRRDLTRDEIVGLDRYLRKHGFDKINVTEAYDNKGITVSTAGSAARTPTGRATILQQEARVLFLALFGNSAARAQAQASSSQVTEARPPSSSAETSNLRNLYQVHEEAETLMQQQRAATEPTTTGTYNNDYGIYAGEGLTIIDDNLYPGLRAGAQSFVPHSTGPMTAQWPANGALRPGRQGVTMGAQDFPSLSDTAASRNRSTSPPLAAGVPASASSSKKTAPPSKTLAAITGAVKKTDPEEVQRQFEAREEARRKALMTNLTFGTNLAALANPDFAQNQQPAIPTSITTTKESEPSEAQLERNRAFAEALGVAPATVRRTVATGWARPTEGKVELDEFGNELGLTTYPDSLILRARENMGMLLKLEKRWIKFLADDTAASLPLNRMDRPSRAFVHEYSDYWRLHTESFDPEPNRYIHCVKLRDTSVPRPLLSEAVQKWRGPTGFAVSTVAPNDHSTQQTAGQSTQGRDLPDAPARQPLQLKPRSVELLADAPSGRSGGVPISLAPSRSMTEPEGTNNRFQTLTERERPKLQLAKRTLPLEVPPTEASASKVFDIEDEMQRRKERMEEQARKEQARLAAKQRALAAAFASDDEADDGSSSSSEWETQEPFYKGSDEES